MREKSVLCEQQMRGTRDEVWVWRFTRYMEDCKVNTQLYQTGIKTSNMIDFLYALLVLIHQRWQNNSMILTHFLLEHEKHVK